MTVLTMPDGTTFAADTLDTLAEQWARWVHGHAWAALSEVQQEAATHECATRLLHVLGVEASDFGGVLNSSAADGRPGPMSAPSPSHLIPDRQSSMDGRLPLGPSPPARSTS
jgi:hypothetical protein